jgi:hypothetical protein
MDSKIYPIQRNQQCIRYPAGYRISKKETGLSRRISDALLILLVIINQGFGSGSGLDPDSVTLWIRICIGNPDPGARKCRNFRGKMHFLIIFKKKFYH